MTDLYMVFSLYFFPYVFFCCSFVLCFWQLRHLYMSCLLFQENQHGRWSWSWLKRRPLHGIPAVVELLFIPLGKRKKENALTATNPSILISKANYIGKVWFTLGKSMLTVPSHFFLSSICEWLPRRLHDFFYFFFGDRSKADQPVVPHFFSFSLFLKMGRKSAFL